MKRRHFLRNGLWVTGALAFPAIVRAQGFVQGMGTRAKTLNSSGPIDLTSCMFWYRADSLSAVGDGNPVSAWTDESGNGRNLSTSGTARPTYRATGGPSSTKTVEFNGSTNILKASAFTPGNAGVSLFAVAKTTSSTATEVICESSDNYNATNGAFIFYANSSNQLVAGHCGNVGKTTWVTTALIGTASFKYLSAVIDMTLSTAEALAWINNVSSGSVGSNSNNTGSFSVSLGLNVGNRADGSIGWAGSICELIGYSVALDDTKRGAIQTYLSEKYSL